MGNLNAITGQSVSVKVVLDSEKIEVVELKISRYFKLNAKKTYPHFLQRQTRPL